MNTYLRVLFIFVLCFFAILLHATVGVSHAGDDNSLRVNVSFYPPKINPGQTTTVTVTVTDNSGEAIPEANVQIHAPEQGYFEQSKNRFSDGLTDQSGVYTAVWRASANTSRDFQVTVSKGNRNPWSMGYLFIVDGATNNYPPLNSNSQGIGSSSNQEKRIKYTITNSTNYHVSLVFYPNKNKASLAPGQKTSCNSPIRNGKFPQVKAHAQNGETWLRTISNHGGEYYIVNRGNKGIKIIP